MDSTFRVLCRARALSGPGLRSEMHFQGLCRFRKFLWLLPRSSALDEHEPVKSISLLVLQFWISVLAQPWPFIFLRLNPQTEMSVPFFDTKFGSIIVVYYLKNLFEQRNLENPKYFVANFFGLRFFATSPLYFRIGGHSRRVVKIKT